MKANSTQEQQLRTEIRWCKEALAIADNFDTPAQEAYKQQIPVEFRHLCEMFGPEEKDELENHLERLQNDISDLQEGEF